MFRRIRAFGVRDLSDEECMEEAKRVVKELEEKRGKNEGTRTKKISD